jgi:hypothetical protein
LNECPDLKAKEWVKLAEGIENDEVPEIIIRLVANAADLSKAPHLKRRYVCFPPAGSNAGFAESVVRTPLDRLAALPPAKPSAD